MSTEKNSINSSNHYVHSDEKSLNHKNEHLKAAENFVKVFNTRASFFTPEFVKSVSKAEKKALMFLTRFAMPPTQMDLRSDFAYCVQAKVPGDHVFAMKDGRKFTMDELKKLVPEWARLAERVLIESDPALADKLMTPLQWNAKAAFEVTFTSAMNELKDIRKTKQMANADHYMKWIVNPLKKAIEHAKEVNPPGNALVGYGDRIPLKEALAIAETLPDEFDKLLKAK